MDKKLASLIIKIAANGAEAEKTLRTLEKKVGDFGKRWEDVGKSITKYVTTPLTALAGVSVAAANTQLQAEAKLLNALRGREDVQKRLMAQASELQSRSTLGDEAIIGQQAFLAALGLTEAQIQQTIEAAVQLSYATGMELEGAVKNLAKTYSGLTGELGESIPALKQFTAEELKAGQAVNFINENYQGFAETAAATGAGPMVQLKNQLGDLAEQIGIILLPAIQKLTEWFSEMVAWMQNISPETMKVIAIIGAVVAAVGPLLTVFGKVVRSLRTIIAVVPTMGRAFLAFAATPAGAVITALAAISAGLISVSRNAEEAKRKLAGIRQQNFEDRKSEAYDLAMQMYNKSSVSDAEIRKHIESYTQALNADVTAWQVSNGGGLNQAQKEALSVQKETIRALEDILRLREREREEQAAMVRQQQAEAQAAKDKAAAEERAALARRVAIAQDVNRNLPTSTSANLSSLKSVEAHFAGISDLKGGPLWDLYLGFVQAESQANEISKTAIRIGDTLAAAFANLTYAVGEGLGNMLAGVNFDFGKTLFSVLGQALKDIGKQIISTSTLIESLKKTIGTLGLGAATIPIGIAAVALGQFLIAKAQQPIKLATGGLAYGPTLAVVGDNPGASRDPEVVAPLSKLREYIGGHSRLELVGNVSFELSGDTARAILSRENMRLSRL